MTDLPSLRKQFWAGKGRLDMLRSRRDELVDSIRDAKEILALRDEVRDALEKLQADSNARIIMAYNSLLTALVADILPSGDRRDADGQDIAIRLSLYTERGLPALDVEGHSGENRVIDLYDGAGGSLTNVVCLGLRSIAAAASGMRRFLCLDEADCWLSPTRIAVFYSVLKRLAEQSGFQTIAISHHNPELFSKGVNILELQGRPRTGLSVRASADRALWPDDEMEGIRSIRLQNFAGFVDATLPLSPGVNAIVGQNNIGKSRVMKALRAVCYGDARDSDIRHGQNQVTVTLTLERGMTLTWSRKLNRNPVQQWTLQDRNGDIMTIDGEFCQSGKRRRGADARVVPAWVTSVMGIERVEGLDIHLTHQKKPVFLLEETATKRAAVLSIGREASRVQDMIAGHKRRVEKATKTVNEGERELNGLLRQVSAIEECHARLETLFSQVEGLEVRIGETARVRDGATEVSRRIEAARHRVVRARTILDILSDLPEPLDISEDIRRARQAGQLAERIEGLSRETVHRRHMLTLLAGFPEAPVLQDDRRPALLAERIESDRRTVQRCQAVGEILATLPEAPVLADEASPAKMAHDIQSCIASRSRAAGELETVNSRISECEKDIDSIMASNGGHCPFCGSVHTGGDHAVH